MKKFSTPLDASDNLSMLVSQGLKYYPTRSLWQFLDDKYDVIRYWAAVYIQLSGTRRDFEQAIELTRNPRTRLREQAAFILGQLGTPKMPFKNESVPILEKLSKDRSSNVRATSIAALGFLKANSSLKSFQTAASDKNKDVRCSAAQAIGCLRRTSEVNKVLRRLARDSNSEVRSWAQMWLKN